MHLSIRQCNKFACGLSIWFEQRMLRRVHNMLSIEKFTVVSRQLKAHGANSLLLTLQEFCFDLRPSQQFLGQSPTFINLEPIYVKISIG